MKGDKIEFTNCMERYLIDKGVYENFLEERTYSNLILKSIPDNLRGENEEAEKEKEKEKKKEKMRQKMREKMEEKEEGQNDSNNEKTGGDTGFKSIGDEEIGEV